MHAEALSLIIWLISTARMLYVFLGLYYTCSRDNRIQLPQASTGNCDNSVLIMPDNENNIAIEN